MLCLFSVLFGWMCFIYEEHRERTGSATFKRKLKVVLQQPIPFHPI